MAAKAFVLIETEAGNSRGVSDAIRKLKGVKSVDTVTGPYDVIAVIEEDNLSDIGELVTSNLHPIQGIYRTVTCLTV